MNGPVPADAVSPVPIPGLGGGRTTRAGGLSAADPGLDRGRSADETTGTLVRKEH